MATKEEKKTPGTQIATLAPSGQIVKMDRSMFDSAEGEVFAGLNLLKLEVGEADGPFILTEVMEDQILNEKYTKGVDVYVGKRCDANGNTIGTSPALRMPASASFAQKCRDDAKLALGDIFAVARDANYKSKNFDRDDCKAYAVKVFKRSGEAPALKPMTAEDRKELRKGEKKTGGSKKKA